MTGLTTHLRGCCRCPRFTSSGPKAGSPGVLAAGPVPAASAGVGGTICKSQGTHTQQLSSHMGLSELDRSLAVAAAVILCPWFQPHWFHVCMLPHWPLKGMCLPGSDPVERVPGGGRCGLFPTHKGASFLPPSLPRDSSARPGSRPGCVQAPHQLFWGEFSQQESMMQAGSAGRHRWGQSDFGFCRRPAAGSPAHHLSAFF